MNDVELGFLAIKKQDHQEAINIFRRVMERKKEVQGYLGFGLAHYHLGDFPTARWAFSKALELDPANQEAEGFLAKSMKTGQRKPVPVRKSLFRTGGGYLEVFDRGWKKFFIKGINLGLGIPGFFPGEFPIKEGTYLTWFGQMAELGVNSIRVYALHPPDFYHGSNAIWVFANIGGARPASPEWVAWPPPGYVPYPVVYARWSFSRPSADFSASTVTMTRGADAIALNRLTIANGYGDNTIVWEPQGLPGGAPESDTVYTVQIGNVKVGAETRSYSYHVTVIDPEAEPPEPQNAARSWVAYW